MPTDGADFRTNKICFGKACACAREGADAAVVAGAVVAQMLSPLNGQKFGELLQESFSCDRFPNYNHAAPQCGCCP